MLLLLEGDEVHSPSPKNHFSEDITLTWDTPIFATSRSHIEYHSTSINTEEIVKENAMMCCRWKQFTFTHEFKEREQVNCEPCKRCYAGFLFLTDIDIDNFAQ